MPEDALMAKNDFLSDRESRPFGKWAQRTLAGPV